jgi:hypothetical protein
MQIFVTLMMVRLFAAIFLYLVLYILSDGPYLGLIAGFANDKEIGNRLIDLFQIQGNDILSLFFLYSSNDGLDYL